MGQDDELKAPAAQLLDGLNGLAATVAVVAGERVIKDNDLLVQGAIVVELGEEECEGKRGLVARR